MGEPLSRDPEALEVELELLTDLEVFLEGLGTLKVNWWWGGAHRLGRVPRGSSRWSWSCSLSWECSSMGWAP